MRSHPIARCWSLRGLLNAQQALALPPLRRSPVPLFHPLACAPTSQVTLFDIQQRSSMAELATPFIKYVVWNNDMSAVALLSKHAIIIADKRLAGAQTVHETIRVKSAAWDDSGVLLYTTLNHLKYCLPNGDSGIIRTLDSPLYITRVAGGVVHALDREGKNRAIQVGEGATAGACWFQAQTLKSCEGACRLDTRILLDRCSHRKLVRPTGTAFDCCCSISHSAGLLQLIHRFHCTRY